MDVEIREIRFIKTQDVGPYYVETYNKIIMHEIEAKITALPGRASLIEGVFRFMGDGQNETPEQYQEKIKNLFKENV